MRAAQWTSWRMRTPEEVVSVREQVALATQRLTHAQRRVLALKLEGWSLSEIGKILGYSRQYATLLLLSARPRMLKALTREQQRQHAALRAAVSARNKPPAPIPAAPPQPAAPPARSPARPVFCSWPECTRPKMPVRSGRMHVACRTAKRARLRHNQHSKPRP